MSFTYLDKDAVARALDWPSLIDALDEMFRTGCEAPPRHHHPMAREGEPDATLLLMPAWSGDVVGTKLVTVTPGNGARGLPAIDATYAVFDGTTGALKAILDGGELTARRTAAASALAARYLARAGAARLGVIGTGRLAPLLAQAHAAARPIREVLVSGRDTAKAAATAQRISAALGLPAQAADLADVNGCDIVSAATLSTEPLIRGAALRPGAHVDLVGAFKPDMRESDGEVFRRAAHVVVDTYPGSENEAGDVIQAVAEGALRREDIAADLAQLARGQIIERGDGDITVFKSAGASLEDLAAAKLCLARTAG